METKKPRKRKYHVQDYSIHDSDFTTENAPGKTDQWLLKHNEKHKDEDEKDFGLSIHWDKSEEFLSINIPFMYIREVYYPSRKIHMVSSARDDVIIHFHNNLLLQDFVDQLNFYLNDSYKIKFTHNEFYEHDLLWYISVKDVFVYEFDSFYKIVKIVVQKTSNLLS
jgi:hypothetical protein